MPSASGVYSLPPGYLAITGQTIQASQHNPPLEDIAAALTLRLSRDGSAPMTGPLQLASGTVGAPGQVFAVDPSSGLYKTTAGIGVAIGGTKVAEFTAAGLASGARLIGELVPYTCTAAPSPVWVLPWGQTLSRTAFPALWTQAQIEIAAGNIFYNNGDGSTTFGIGDMRGRVPAGWDVMGGTAASRLTTAGSGVNGAVLGTGGGAQNKAILQANLPAVALTTTINDPGHGHPGSVGAIQGTIPNIISAAQYGGNNTGINMSQTLQIANNTTGITASTALGGSGTAIALVQPTLVCNYILFAGGPS